LCEHHGARKRAQQSDHDSRPHCGYRGEVVTWEALLAANEKLEIDLKGLKS